MLTGQQGCSGSVKSKQEAYGGQKAVPPFALMCPSVP